MADRNPQIELQPMCNEHDVETVERLRVGPEGPWRATLVTMQLLLFRAMMADERIQRRTGGDAAVISLVLAELGCPCCARRADFRRALVVMRKGLAHASAVARGDLYDPDFRVPANSPPRDQEAADAP